MPRFFYAVFFAFLPWPAAILFCFSSSSFSSLHRGCCPAWAAGRLPGAGHGVRGVSYPLSGCNAARALRKKRGFSLCLGADVCSRSRQSVSFFKGNTLPLHPRTPLFAVTRKESLELTVPRRREPSRLCRVMFAPAAALRPPPGRPGSPSRPRHRCISGKGEGRSLAGGQL